MGALSSTSTASNTIVDVAVATDATSTLVAALKAASADVISSLSGPGPFTVFAPTNDAFDALPEGVLDGLLADPDTLTAILLYHVVEGQVEAKDIPALLIAVTLNGQSVALRSDGDGVTVNDATVVIADVVASNGVIHVIDKVLIPEGVLPKSSTDSDTVLNVAGAIQTFNGGYSLQQTGFAASFTWIWLHGLRYFLF